MVRSKRIIYTDIVFLICMYIKPEDMRQKINLILKRYELMVNTNSMQWRSGLIILVILIFSNINVDTLRCYECTSLQDDGCGDPFNRLAMNENNKKNISDNGACMVRHQSIFYLLFLFSSFFLLENEI